ncbi:MAG TPA: DUF6526 family protein [Bryobacteraceae bacterium]|nr:DUF6526 family protein [Bryobacteraceae bacterium]
MSDQNYANHRQFVTMFHKVLVPALLLTFIGSIVNLTRSWGDHERIYSAALLVVLCASTMLLAFLARIFSLRAQDRAIRAEESLRYYILTGQLPDQRLTIRQIVALRFAPDEELQGLARRAAEENLAADSIKRAVKNWRADLYRV